MFRAPSSFSSFLLLAVKSNSILFLVTITEMITSSLSCSIYFLVTIFFPFKVLMGNDDKNSEVKHVVYGVLTRYLRFRPQTYQGGVCMRTEVFGVKQKPSEFEI